MLGGGGGGLLGWGYLEKHKTKFLIRVIGLETEAVGLGGGFDYYTPPPKNNNKLVTEISLQYFYKEVQFMMLHLKWLRKLYFFETTHIKVFHDCCENRTFFFTYSKTAGQNYFLDHL
jgi:hypothetical protein